MTLRTAAVSVNTNAHAPERKRFGVGDKLQFLKCNHCGTPVLFEHRAMHAYDCRQRRNAQKLGGMNLSKDGKALYAVVITRFKGGKWHAPETLYAHANSPGEAKRIATAGMGLLKVVECGLAVGWFQQEKTGIILAG